MALEGPEIILVEDNQSDVHLILRAFKQNHLDKNVTVFEDGETALHYLTQKDQKEQNNRPKLVLLDLNLPKMSGLDLLQKLRANPDTSQMPVVVLSSSDYEKDVVESYNLGVNSYIVKPVSVENLMQALQNLQHYWMLLWALMDPKKGIGG